ncbi:MAG: pentapeptide repeat-containing protein [Rhodospirillales bacterium]|nr:pentapeptide repeat-containing protein [Rhodospirillales bacterium]
MSKYLTPVNIGVVVIAVLSAVGWFISDHYRTAEMERLRFRDAFFEKIAVYEDKTGVVCNGCWLHELNRDHTVPVDIKRYIVDIPHLQHIDLAGSDLTGSYFTKALATDANFSGAMLDTALFDLADLSNADLSGASLRGANFRYATLTGTNFRGADLSPKKDTSLLRYFHAEFEEHGGATDLKGAVIAGADFTGANLSGANMASVKGIESAIFCNTVMPDESISNTGCK